MAEIGEALTERVLERLGFNARPAAPDLDGLTALYRAWCRTVPFDNVRKRIHVASGDASPLPGNTPDDLLEGLLTHGVGGTCWAMHGGLVAFLGACGFDVQRAIGTMLAAPSLPPNHGSAVVRLDGTDWLVDGCIQHGRPLALVPGEASRTEHPAWGVTATPDGNRWRVRWRSPFAPEGFDCRIDSLDGDIATFNRLHENTRAWSPFNYELFVRVHRGDGVLGLSRGMRIEFRGDGSLVTTPLDHAGRLAFLVDELGVSESLAASVPADVPTPPPPGSATAARAESRG